LTVDELNGCKSTDVANSKGEYQEPIAIMTLLFDHRDGHYVRPNMVAIKYLNFKKNIDLNAHVRVFNPAIKTNVETSKEYMINVFRYRFFQFGDVAEVVVIHKLI
jgi:hypothetical protein